MIAYPLPDGYRLYITDAGYYSMGWVSNPHNGYIVSVDYFVHYAGTIRADRFA